MLNWFLFFKTKKLRESSTFENIYRLNQLINKSIATRKLCIYAKSLEATNRKQSYYCILKLCRWLWCRHYHLSMYSNIVYECMRWCVYWVDMLLLLNEWFCTVWHQHLRIIIIINIWLRILSTIQMSFVVIVCCTWMNHLYLYCIALMAIDYQFKKKHHAWMEINRKLIDIIWNRIRLLWLQWQIRALTALLCTLLYSKLHQTNVT